MSSKAYADRLAHALESTLLAESVNNSFSENRVSVLLRVKNGVDQQWNELIRKILLATNHFAKEAHAWNAHICRTYFLHPQERKKLVFGWSITITANDIGPALDEVIRVIHGGDPELVMGSDGELTEFPLVGASPNRNIPGSSGKGASTIGGVSDFRPPRR